MSLAGLCEDGALWTSSPREKPVQDPHWDGKRSQPAQADFGVLIACSSSPGPACPAWDTRGERDRLGDKCAARRGGRGEAQTSPW